MGCTGPRRHPPPLGPGACWALCRPLRPWLHFGAEVGVAGVGAGDGASPGSPPGHFEDHVAVYVSARRRARSRSGSSARGTVTRGRPSPPAAVYPPVNRGVLAVPAIKLRILSSLRISFSCQLCILGLRSITPTTRLNLLKNKNKHTNKQKSHKHRFKKMYLFIYLFNLCTPCVIQLRRKTTCKKRIICLPPPHPPF